MADLGKLSNKELVGIGLHYVSQGFQNINNACHDAVDQAATGDANPKTKELLRYHL